MNLDQLDRARQLARDLGITFENSGEPNVAELFRVLLEAGEEAYRSGNLVRRTPAVFKGKTKIGRQGKADDLEYGALDE
jgi:hypothetical protein